MDDLFSECKDIFNTMLKSIEKISNGQQAGL